MNYQKLNMSEIELTKISVIARERKFEIVGSSLIYPRDVMEKLKFFNNSYIFLYALVRTQTISKEIRNKIGRFLGQFKHVCQESFEYVNDYQNSNLSMEKSNIQNKAFKLYLANRQLIDSMIAEIFPVGRRATTFDPEVSQGVY